MPTPKIKRTTTSSPTLSKLPSMHISPSSSGSQSAHMLHLIEPQLSSSYRRAFIPIYQRPIAPIVGVPPSSSIVQRKMSIVSTRRMSSVMGLRKRESNASQFGVLTTQHGQNRLSLPPIYKQPKESVTPARLSDTDALNKLRAKNLITAEN